MKYKTFEDLPTDTIERLDAFRDICSEIRKFANMEGTELGEASAYLIELYRYTDYVSDKFKVELEKELFYTYVMFHEDFDVVEETTEQVQKYTTKTLVPKE